MYTHRNGYLATASDAFDEAQEHKHRRDSKADHQVPDQVTGLVKTARDLQHIMPVGDRGEKGTIHYQNKSIGSLYRYALSREVLNVSFSGIWTNVGRLQEIPFGSIYKNSSKNRAKLALVFAHF